LAPTSFPVPAPHAVTAATIDIWHADSCLNVKQTRFDTMFHSQMGKEEIEDAAVSAPRGAHRRPHGGQVLSLCLGTKRFVPMREKITFSSHDVTTRLTTQHHILSRPISTRHARERQKEDLSALAPKPEKFERCVTAD